MASTKPKGRITVIFRNDDPSAISDMDHERKIFGLFQRYGICQTIGVIPKVSLTNLHDPSGVGERAIERDDPIATFLREYAAHSGSEIALHGVTHRTNRFSVPAKRFFSEFHDLPLEEQIKMLRDGMTIFERAFGFRPETFIPPWNRLDSTTVLACREVGIKTISGRANSGRIEGLACLGANTDLPRFASHFQRARRGRGHAFLTILFHSSTLGRKEELDLLESTLQQVSTDEECECMTISGAVARYTSEIALANEAGRNIVEGYELDASPRANGCLYFKALPAVGKVAGMDEMLAQARELYWAGEYEAAAKLGDAIDRRAAYIVWFWRWTIGVMGLLAGWLIAKTFPPPAHSFVGFSVAAALALVGSYLVSRRVLAEPTRAEIVRAGAFFATGIMLLASWRCI